MCYSGYMTENMVEQKETPTAGPEGAVNTSGAQASGKKAERSYEVVAVIPIELFVPGNRKKVREAINDPEGKNNNKFVRVFPTADINNTNSKSDASRIGRHIKDFSAYEYEIYEIRDKDPWSKAVCEIVNDEIKKYRPEKERNNVKKIREKLQEKRGKECYLDTEIIFAMPFVPDNSVSKSGVDGEADINENTGIVISLLINM